ncbi:uncharacterized protein [Cherax quadricarinatus]|nr:uncharacterized protein LOC128696053 isoform X2 [Cherax quadricarinatus]
MVYSHAYKIEGVAGAMNTTVVATAWGPTRSPMCPSPNNMMNPPMCWNTAALHLLLQSGEGGKYNSSCGPFLPCYPHINLVCVDGVCMCISGFTNDKSGGCENPIIGVLTTWIWKIIAIAVFFIILFMLLHQFACKRRWCELWGREEQQEEEDRRTCWSDAPPAYLEVVEAPPTYTEAMAKIAESSEGTVPEGLDTSWCAQCYEDGPGVAVMPSEPLSFLGHPPEEETGAKPNTTRSCPGHPSPEDDTGAVAVIPNETLACQGNPHPADGLGPVMITSVVMPSRALLCPKLSP